MLKKMQTQNHDNRTLLTWNPVLNRIHRVEILNILQKSIIMDLLSPKQAEEYCFEKYKLIVGANTIRHWTKGLKNRKLDSLKIGGKIFIKPSDLDGFLFLMNK